MRLWKTLVRRSVIVNLKNGTAFYGVLWEIDREFLILRNATLQAADAATSPIPVDGEVVVERRDVDFYQFTLPMEGGSG